MRRLAAALFLVSWLGAACQSSPGTPAGTFLPAATCSRAPAQTPTSAPLAAAALTPAPARAPTPPRGPLTDADARVLIRDEIVARGVASDTVRITTRDESRRLSIRYSSTLRVDDRVFEPQTVLIALAVARITARVDPPMSGGIHLGVIPGGDGEVGMRVTIIEGAVLQAWSNNSIGDREFVSQWIVGSVTRE